MSRPRLACAVAAAVVLLGCPGPTTPATGPSSPKGEPAAPELQPAPGAPLDFALDPLDKELDHVPESTALRGRKAIVLVVQSYDGASLAALRALEPLLSEPPKDTGCLLVAVQPLADRAIVRMFFDAIQSPCRRAIGDPKRGRLGDLARVSSIPTVLVLRKDGTLVGGYTGGFDEAQVRGLLAKAN